MKDTQRVEYVGITDSEALEALQILCRTEGIIPALESSHALAQVIKISKKLRANDIVIVCLPGSGEKDLDIIKEYDVNLIHRKWLKTIKIIDSYCLLDDTVRENLNFF